MSTSRQPVLPHVTQKVVTGVTTPLTSSLDSARRRAPLGLAGGTVAPID
jgi:hypothetical protein